MQTLQGRSRLSVGVTDRLW